MAKRDELVLAIQRARTNDQLVIAVAALDQHDQARTAALAQSRELDFSATAVRETLSPLPAFERHTGATDWLGDYEAPADYHTAMVAEAARWYRGIPRDLAADPEEFNEQALGHAYTAASAYGDSALEARKVFMTYVGYLTRQAASGLPQIQQTVDGNNQPAQTPLPPEPFDNFQPEQNALNQVESPNRQSQISSDGAPGIQELERQDAGGSGFGSGPEREDTHTTSMDTSNSYAEVPLGPPGQIPTAPPGAAPSAPSTPNPAMGMEDNDEGADQRRQASIQVAAYTGPDQDGFRWHIGSDQDVDTFATPYHERCGSLHWPEQACHNGMEHTASVAVGYVMNAEDFQRQARHEAMGMHEGDLVLRRAAGDLGKVVAHHNAIAAAFRAEARTDDEIAWLHGYLARVRPVLARQRMTEHDEAEGAGWQPRARNRKRKKKQKKGDEWDGDEKTGSRLDFPLAAEAAMTKGAPFAGYKDFADCTRRNRDKGDPDAYCGYIKHKVEDKGKSKKGSMIRLSAADLAAANAELAKLAQGWGAGDDYYAGNEGRYSEGYEGADAGIPHHLRGSFQELWHDDPDSWEHREPTDADRAAFRRHVQLHYPPEVYKAYFRHQGASSLPQIQEITDSHDNPDPGGDQLNTAVMFPLIPAFGGEDGEQSKEAARSSGRPSNSALAMFGRLDAMEGKAPRHKDQYVFGVKAHGVYLRAHNEARGVIDAINGKDPVSKEKYAEQTGRPDLHEHYMGVYSEMKARRSPGAPTTAALRRQADFMTKPHQSTDDLNAPYNSAQTTPQPQSSNTDADAAQGAADAREDAAAGERPTFADNSSMVSPYVKAYAEEYARATQPGGQQDVPGAMGGDSGQPLNAQQAQTGFMVSKAVLRRRANGDLGENMRMHMIHTHGRTLEQIQGKSYEDLKAEHDTLDCPATRNSKTSLRRQGACIGCGHMSHLGEPCNSYGCTHQHYPGEMGGGPGSHAVSIPPDLAHHSPDDRYQLGISADQATYSPAEYVARPGSKAELMDHLAVRHGVTYKGDKDPGDRFLLQLHERFHNGQTADDPQSGPHQHEEPGMDPVFGTRRVAHDFTEGEREEAAHSLGPEHKLPVNSEQDLKNAHTRAHQVKGIPESTVDAYLDRLDKEYGYSGEHAHDRRAASLRRISAVFITREAARHPDFRRGYKFAARWQPGRRLVALGSPAFEAGMYAGITDRPRVQAAWAAEHYRQSRRHPVLSQRLDAHSGFTVKFARANPSRYLISGNGYLVRAAGTSVDLITDGPGTSPDPMGSTPLNGPGQPPPMGGGEDPARSGGIPPYQGAEPGGSAPVAPDDAVGQPQEPPQESGPFTQTFSGRQPGNADLAPVAPNTAGGAGYSNADAYQGDPMRKAMAFRQRVQASLAARRAS